MRTCQGRHWWAGVINFVKVSLSKIPCISQSVCLSVCLFVCLSVYHAPYTNINRYWTGLMFLLCFVLFLISVVNVLGDPSINLLATATIAILALPTILGTTIYMTVYLSLLNTSFILNLANLSVVLYCVRPMHRMLLHSPQLA